MTGKVRVQLLLDKELVEAVDALVREVDGNRTGFIAVCVENGLQDMQFLSKFGLTPKRIKKIAAVLRRLGYLETPEGDGWATSDKSGNLT